MLAAITAYLFMWTCALLELGLENGGQSNQTLQSPRRSSPSQVCSRGISESTRIKTDRCLHGVERTRDFSPGCSENSQAT